MNKAFEIVHSNRIASIIRVSNQFETVEVLRNEQGERIELHREKRISLHAPAIQYIIIVPSIGENRKMGIQDSVSVYSGSGSYVNAIYDFKKLAGEINATQKIKI